MFLKNFKNKAFSRSMSITVQLKNQISLKYVLSTSRFSGNYLKRYCSFMIAKLPRSLEIEI